ncbi:hypothetical protein [Candidatus Uabimicrobium amorphum]|uniref:Chromosome partition protein Smc n=1 Tax=Uabimicrobium amorphum TaxID=2596890 RepID=A0A5S9IRR7_UABAM|nr:hypothetical protein [Candidatus Uabimicrobium amorphum]BBM86396.1 chromosome partition protein Smc [Candidatus Uabimicrobium amorphum]
MKTFNFKSFLLIFMVICAFTGFVNAERVEFKFDIIKCDEKFIEEPSGDVKINVRFPENHPPSKIEIKMIERRLQKYFKKQTKELEDKIEEKNDQIKTLLEQMELPDSDPVKIKGQIEKVEKRFAKYYKKEKADIVAEAKDIIRKEWHHIVDNDKELSKAKKKKIKKGLKIGIKILGGAISIATAVLGTLATVAGTSWNPGAPASVLAIVAGSASVIAASLTIVSGIRDLINVRKEKIKGTIEAEKESLKILLNKATTDKDWQTQAKMYLSSYEQALKNFKVDIAKVKKEATKLDKQVEKEQKKIDKLDEKIARLRKKTKNRFAYFKKAKNKKKQDLQKINELEEKQDKAQEHLKASNDTIDEMIDKILEMEDAVDGYEETGKLMKEQLEAYASANVSTREKILKKIEQISGVSITKLEELSKHVSKIASLTKSIGSFLMKVVKLGT